MTDKELWLTSQPVCPFCGSEEPDAWEINFGGLEGDTEVSCGSCGEEYCCSREASIYYTTKKIAQPNGGAVTP